MTATLTRPADVLDALERVATSKLGHALPTRSDQLAVLALVDGPLTMSALGDRIDLSRAAITSQVDRLEAAGVLTRTIDSTDRRCILITLTELGRDLADGALEANDA